MLDISNKIVVPFKRWHYDWLASASLPGEGYTIKLPLDIQVQLEGQNSWTGVVDGNPIVCAGTMQQWPGRHTAWAYLAQNTGPHMLWITRQVRRAVEKVKGRVEFTVRKDFAAGQEWARLLGFEIETPCLKQFGPQNEDHVGYVRIN